MDDVSWNEIGGIVGKRPSCIKAVRDAADFISSLKKDSYLFKIVDNGLDVLKENMFAGERIEKKKFPKYYVQKYGINNLYKYNLDAANRLIYTLVTDELGITVVVLGILSHKEYEKRFGYR